MWILSIFLGVWSIINPSNLPIEKPILATTATRPITHLIIHASATKAGHKVSAETILRWHSAPPPQGRGWTIGGYHCLVSLNGQVEQLYPLDSITNGAMGINDQAVHVCYIGGVDEHRHPQDTRTKRQKKALAKLVWTMIDEFPDIIIGGHDDIRAWQGHRHKACPSFDTTAWLKTIGVDEKHFLIP